jgi:hypothetical protein
VPIVPGEEDRYNRRMEQAQQTPGAIYSNFEAYSLAMQDHNAAVTQYIEQEGIPTSTVVDGKTLYLNLGTTPAYYQEQADGGQLKNIWHPDNGLEKVTLSTLKQEKWVLTVLLLETPTGQKKTLH